MIPNDNCTSCGACVNICPTNALSCTIKDNFYMVKIDKNKCINCNACEKICPLNKKRRYEVSWKQSKHYAAWATDTIIRNGGSSGGLFQLLAENVLNDGGIVYGAAFSDDNHYLTQQSTEMVDLKKLCKSKYVESNTGYIFRDIKSKLNKGIKILYCGTSCQIDGLLSYLGRKYDNLILCDLLCHGTPGIGIYQKYVTELENKYGKIESISFRSKYYGWKSYCIKILFKSKKVYIKTKYLDPYLLLFFDNISIRESCISCNRVENSQADITLGDFWKVDNTTIPDDNLGISMISIHTDNGRKIFDNIILNNNMNYTELSLDDVKYAFEKNINVSKKREETLKYLSEKKSIFKINKDFSTRVKGVLYELRAVNERRKTGGLNNEKK